MARTRGVKWELSSLPVGDFLWLAREVGGKPYLCFAGNLGFRFLKYSMRPSVDSR